MRTLRLIPVVIATAMLLFVMKTYDLATGDMFRLSGVSTAVAQEEPTSADDDMMSDTADGDVLGEGMADTDVEQPEVVEDALLELPQPTSRDLLLDRLGERRTQLEQREQDLRVREQLLEAAEARLEERIAELEALEETAANEAEQQMNQRPDEIERLVVVYSSMRAKDAAAIFDRLELPILFEVADAMSPRKMADILGEMDPDAARRLTVALAGSSVAAPPASPMNELPQIQGVPIQ